ncbi:hypothetical protein ILUMI_03020 [Ignelater luminosus]|uniref:Peptidase S1 domain-containing protein n=1 Tax=Ignelater luminosus TaxID=2038154 RepID=A0A8K0GIQ9_IGNLU|nr:hypothetical protein ILUMI_03020 [Ignelater luminosus]
MKIKWQSCLFTSNIVLAIINVCVLLCIFLETFFRYECEPPIGNDRTIHVTAKTIQVYPFIAAFVFVLSSDIRFICASSIISKNWVLTTEDCLEAGEEFELENKKIISNHNELEKGIQHQVKKCIRAYEISLDLGLVQVVEPFKARFEKLIPVAKKGYKFIPSKIVTVVSWLMTTSGFLLEPNDLKGTALRLYKYQECVNVMNRLRMNYSDLPHLDKSMVCAGPFNITEHQDVCHFGSGSPLVDDDLLIGLVLWTPTEIKSSLNCGGYPGIYVHLWNSLQWIQKIEKKEKQKIAFFIETPNWSRPILPD